MRDCLSIRCGRMTGSALRLFRVARWTSGSPEGYIYQLGRSRRGKARGRLFIRCGRIPKKGVSPETSSPNRDLGGRILRRLLLKMSVSLETSSKNGEVEIAGETFGSSKMSISPETSSKK